MCFVVNSVEGARSNCKWRETETEMQFNSGNLERLREKK